MAWGDRPLCKDCEHAAVPEHHANLTVAQLHALLPSQVLCVSLHVLGQRDRGDTRPVKAFFCRVDGPCGVDGQFFKARKDRAA